MHQLRRGESPLPPVCEGCEQRGILELVRCSGGATGEVYFCQNCTVQHERECAECQALKG